MPGTILTTRNATVADLVAVLQLPHRDAVDEKPGLLGALLTLGQLLRPLPAGIVDHRGPGDVVEPIQSGAPCVRTGKVFDGDQFGTHAPVALLGAETPDSG